MHFYWRIIEELKFLGEAVIFHDPSLKREYKLWLKKNEYVLRLNQDDIVLYPIMSLN